MLSLLSILVKMRVALTPGRIARTMTPNSASSMFRDSLRSDCGLGRRVDGAVRVPLLGRERGDVDDHPGALRPEGGQERLDQRRDAADVGLVLPVDLLHAR